MSTYRPGQALTAAPQCRKARKRPIPFDCKLEPGHTGNCTPYTLRPAVRYEDRALRWQAYDEQAHAGACECCASGAHNDRPCIACGHYLRDCRKCHLRITMLGGMWTDPDGGTCCTADLSAAYTPHEP
jgi:hypothetical protein